MRDRAIRLRASSLAAAAALLLASGCVASQPQGAESADLLAQLTDARANVSQQNDLTDEGCTTVGDVLTRLYGDPGLADLQPAWSALRDAADALQAACGELTMLAQPAPNASSALAQARVRWQQGIQREIGVACDHLRVAASSLGRPAPC